ncbi:MAG: UTP--glucose-1-phosphate uridylyltransferase [Chthoniobacteraceae bacterium]
MSAGLSSIITSQDAGVRNRSLDEACKDASPDELIAECASLDAFRRTSQNLYERVRALFFLYAIHRFHLPARQGFRQGGIIPFRGHEHLLERRFEDAIELFQSAQRADGPSDALSSALATAYHRLAFQTLADQVRRSVRSVRGNQWMFRMGHPKDQPLRVRPELLRRNADGSHPILREQTPVRMDLTHSAWSDIFFLGMDFPEGARVLNISVDLGVHGRDPETKPPVSAWLRVIDEPVLRLVSVDLGASAEISSLSEVFDFAKDYLGLLKAAIIASGIVPPGIEGSGQSLTDLLAQMLGPGRGLELVSSVNDIPKGSRLAVSTNLLAALIGVCMRATGQAESLTGPLREEERRLVLARALLGEWIGGSGGGWQDIGGVWPGIKLIEGVAAQEGDPEHGISRGRLMPRHHVFTQEEIPEKARQALQDSLVVVHGGMAQNVGPILEMVTEKYLLRSGAEWQGRQEALGFLDEILDALRESDIARVGDATTRNFSGPIQTIIPWASTYYTERLIEQVRAEFGKDFHGFWMLGGMSGGGMGFMFAPHRKAEAQGRMQAIMSATKRELSASLPFAMEPVVYDFRINENGTVADLLNTGAEAKGASLPLMPKGYYLLLAPRLLREDPKTLTPSKRAELDKFAAACRTQPELRGMVQELFDALLPRGLEERAGERSLDELLAENGFDREAHEQIRADLKAGRIGLAQNRLPANSVIEDVQPGDVILTEEHAAADGSGTGVPPVGVGQSVSAVPDGPPPFKPFSEDSPESAATRHLPHWQVPGATYFVTFRLADSLPAAVVRRLKDEFETWLRQNPRPWNGAQRAEYYERFHESLEVHLDQGAGSCTLAESPAAEIVEDALRHFDGERYWLGSYVVMPNHVHVIVRPKDGHPLSDILHSWKSFSAHQINKHVGRAGTLWQDESFDHIVRHVDEWKQIDRYISENPGKARLGEGKYRLGCGSAGRAGGTPATLRQAGRVSHSALGLASLRNGEVAVVTLAAGAASRWTQGAGVVKSLHPFCKLAGRHRTFLETHLAKSRRTSRIAGTPVPHIFTTSYLTHGPISAILEARGNYGYEGPVLLSRGKSVGLRFIPAARDLRFAWEEMPQQMLDEQQQKVRDSLRAALLRWAESTGEAGDYRDNLPLQCLHPVGHFYEIPNLLRNGTLAALLRERPQLKTLMLHNIDTVGANLDPAVLGRHLASGATLSFEVITRRLEDRGGGLARVDGRVRLVEGLAMPREEIEFGLTYYNTLTTWIDVDGLLRAFGLSRTDLDDGQKVLSAIRDLAARVPTYITLKEVKKRWGHGQEDIFPVAQFEKLWGDLTALPEIESKFLVVPRLRGQQLKEQAQLDGWLRDGSAAYVESLCDW